MKKLIFRKISKDLLIFFSFSIILLGLIVWTLQAINYFDLVAEDGHGIKLYFLYSILFYRQYVFTLYILALFCFFRAFTFCLILHE